MKKSFDLIKQIPEAMLFVASCALTVLMVLTVADIIGRSIGAFFLEGLIEISTLTLVLLGFFSFGFKFVKGAQIFVDLFTLKVPPKINAALDSIWTVFSGIFFLVIAYPIFREGVDVHASGQRTINMEWSLMIYVVPAVIGCVASGLTCIIVGIYRVIRFSR